MRLIIDCDEDLLAHAIAVLNGELAPSYKPWRERYDKMGWGWSHRMTSGAFCFVRRIKDGLSLKQTTRTIPAESGGPVSTGGEADGSAPPATAEQNPHPDRLSTPDKPGDERC